MDFGIVTAKVDEIGYITHAENLGYSHCWVTDSPMIRSNCWAVLALAAQATRTMRIGTGVTCPACAWRPPPPTASPPSTGSRPGAASSGSAPGTPGCACSARSRCGWPIPRIRRRRAAAAARRGGRLQAGGRDAPVRFQMREHRFIDLEPRSPCTWRASVRRRRRWPARSPTGSSPACRAGARCRPCWPTPGAAPRGRAATLPAGLLHVGDGDARDAGAGRGARLRRASSPSAAPP